MVRPSQLTLPWEPGSALGRADFIVGLGNAAAVRFVDSWPDWPGPAALFGPSGCGKSHLVQAWAAGAGAVVFAANTLDQDGIAALDPARPVAVEDVEQAPPGEGRDRALFALFERGTPFLLTGRAPPPEWPFALPDLGSRFAALIGLPLWAPDDALLAALARKLFTDRQLAVPDAVVMRMVTSLERAPGAIREFVAMADARALAEKRPVNTGLIRQLLEEAGASS